MKPGLQASWQPLLAGPHWLRRDEGWDCASATQRIWVHPELHLQDGPEQGTNSDPTRAHLHRWRSLARRWWPPQTGRRPGIPQAGRLLRWLVFLVPAAQEGQVVVVAGRCLELAALQGQPCWVGGRWLVRARELLRCLPAAGRAPTHAHPAAAAGWGWVVVAWGWEALVSEAAWVKGEGSARWF